MKYLILIFKSYISYNSPVYNFFRIFYYCIKKVLDFIFFKLKFPTKSWYYIYRNKKNKSFSQYGQDLFIKDNIKGRNLFYVEIGCNHPVQLSNSYLLEKNNWKGISIDPLKQYKKTWKKKRKQKFLNIAIGKGKKKKYIEFSGPETWIDMLSGFKEYIKKEHMLTFKYKEYDVKVKGLKEIINKTKVDLLLIDVEGAELEILKSLKTLNQSPKNILVENASYLGGNNEIRKFLFKKKYKLIARFGCADDFFKLNNN